MPRLVIEKGVDKGKHLEISSGGTLLIGRDSSANFRLADTMASRLHFRIERRDDALWLVDLKSMNGTYVNGSRIKEVKLSAGDRVQVGETLFTFVEDDEAGAQDSFIGQLVAGYRVLERVGRGGMGTVYKAEQLALKRIVALKVISPENVKDPTFMELFLREARATAQLNHPNIVQVYDAKADDGAYFYSMEFMPSGSVQDLLSKEKKLSPAAAVRMALDAARGLEYAERKQIVHRDIKPDNLMVGEMGVVKIGDLGLAQRLSETLPVDESKTVLGTPHFIAPEQVLGKPADHRSDIYALGATIYRMLAGTTPFTGANVREIVTRKVKEDPPALCEVDEAITPAVSDVVRKMMERDPANRMQTMPEVVAALEGCLAAPAPTVAAAAGGGRRPAALWIGVAAAAVIAIVAAAALRPGETPPPANGTAGGTPPAPDGPSEAEETLAQEYLRQGREAEKTLKADSAVAVKNAMAHYQRILDKCPRSAAVAEAKTRLAALEGMLGEAAAVQALRERERTDAADFARLFRGEPDAAALREAVSAADRRYAEVEKTHPKSAAAVRARAYREHARAWLAKAEAARAKAEEVGAAARREADAGRFGAAIGLWRAHEEEARGQALRSPFDDGRYGELPAGGAAGARIRELEAGADAAFRKLQQEAQALAGQGKFDEAKSRLAAFQGAVGLAALADRVRAEAAEVDRRLLEKADRERREAQDRERKRNEEDAARLAQAGRAIEDPLRRYELRRAADAYKTAAAKLEVPSHREAAARRLQDLEWMARVKAEFIRRATLKPPPRDFLRPVKTRAHAGEIAGANEESITVSVEKGKAEFPVKWADFAAPEFCQLFRRRWNMGGADWLGYGCLCLEYGVLEEAAEGFRQAKARAGDDAATREAAERRLAELESGGAPPASRDLDAQRRLQQAKALRDQKRYAQAQTELETLLASYADTETVRKNQAEIQKLLEEAAERVREQQTKGQRSEALQRARDAMAAEERDARGRKKEIWDRIRALPDDADRLLQAGAVQLAWQEWGEAAIRFEELRAHMESKLGEYIANNPTVVGAMYQGLVRAQILAGDRARADRMFREADYRLQNVDPWRSWMSAAVARWRDLAHPAGLQEVKRLKAELEADPANPDLLWRLCQFLDDEMPLRLEERQRLRALAVVDPEHAQVASGEVLYRLAENALAFREVPQARALYVKLQTEFAGHPRVKDPAGAGAVDARLKECDALMERMGYRR